MALYMQRQRKTFYFQRFFSYCELFNILTGRTHLGLNLCRHKNYNVYFMQHNINSWIKPVLQLVSPKNIVTWYWFLFILMFSKSSLPFKNNVWTLQ